METKIDLRKIWEAACASDKYKQFGRSFFRGRDALTIQIAEDKLLVLTPELAPSLAVAGARLEFGALHQCYDTYQEYQRLYGLHEGWRKHQQELQEAQNQHKIKLIKHLLKQFYVMNFPNSRKEFNN